MDKSNVYFLSSIGNDSSGDSITLFARENSLNIDLLQRTKKYPTGKATVFLNEKTNEKTKVPDYIIHENVAFDNIEYRDKIQNVVANNNFDIFYFNILSQRNKLSHATIKNIFDKINAKIKIF